MVISPVNLMGSSVILNVPSPPSSSSSSSSWSSRIHQAAENEGEDRAGTGMGGKLSDRNRFSKRLGHRVPRLVRDDVKNGRTLNSLNRGAEESDNGDNQLNLEIETLERKVLMMMIAKGLKGDELGKFADDEEILKAMKLKDKLKDLGIGAEDRRKKSGKGMVLKPEIRRRKANPNTKKGSQQIEKTGKMIHEAMNVSDDNGEKDEKKLSKEIEVLEAMLERGRYGLLDMQMMMEEVKAMKGSEKMENEIKEKMTELESELREVKNAIVALKRKKIKELKNRIQKEEENEMKYEEQEEQQEQEEYDEEEEEESKINWGSVVAALGAVAVAAAAVFLMGRSSSKMEFKSEKNRRQNQPR